MTEKLYDCKKKERKKNKQEKKDELTMDFHLRFIIIY